MNRFFAFFLALIFASLTISSACVAGPTDWIHFTLEPDGRSGEIQANFRDESGEVRPRSYPATLSDYVMGAIHAGLVIVALEELSVDEELATRNERSRKWLGWPALFLMTLRRA